MVDETASRLGRRDRHFTLVLFSAGALLLAFISVMENDRRGLLRWDRPGVFASGDVQSLPNSYDVVYLGLKQRQGRDDREGRGAARLIPSRGGASDIVTPAGAGPQSISVAPLVQVNPSPATGSTGTPLTGNASPSTRGGVAPFMPSNLGGGGGSVPGVIVVEAPPPVPAVPEPAAWLLMILGVGFLAAALRRRAAADNVDDSENLVGLVDQVG